MIRPKITNFIVLFVSLTACTNKPTSEEKLLEQAFDAIKSDDWEAYSALTITYADFLMKAQHINAFNEKNSYAGGVLKPEQRKQQEQEFRATVKGGPGIIDFKNSSFVSSGRIVHSGSLEAFEGPDIPYRIFGIVAESAGGSAVPEYPRFMVVPWNEEFRIMKLEFPRDGGTQ
ncbi:MAG: hypothetical protein HYY49_09345 [Ignavibacteriales bacterium]|nr:hypothetical protein [Ignavibacteriales bacterium]